MIDRRKIAVPLVLVGAGLAVLASSLDTYGPSNLGDQRGAFTSSMWIVTSDGVEDLPNDAYYAAGWPVVITALVLAVSALLLLRERTAGIGRPMAFSAAGGLAGIVLFYVFQLQHEEELINAWPDGQQYDIVYLEGTYLLVVAAVVGLVGAAFAQQKQQQEQPEEDEDAVVVHQLDPDDDTPPFGLAIPHEEEAR